MGRKFCRQDRQAAGRLFDHLLRCDADHPRCIDRVAKSGKPVNRANVRDAIASTNLKTLQGDISFDANGDMNSKVVSIFQVQYDRTHPMATSCVSSNMSASPPRPDKGEPLEVQQLPVPGKP